MTTPDLLWRARQLGSNLAWTVLSALVARTGNFVLVLVSAKLLQIEKVGQIGVVQATISTLAALSALGFSMFITRSISSRAGDDDSADTLTAVAIIAAVVVSGIVSVTLYIYADVLARTLFQQEELGILFRIGALGIVPFSGLFILSGLLAGLGQFADIARLNFSAAALSLLLSLIGLLTYGVPGVIGGAVLGGILTVAAWGPAIRSLFSSTHIQLPSAIRLRDVGRVTSFVFPAFLGAALVEPVNLLCVSILSHSSNGAVQVGIYYYVLPWANLILFLPNLAGQALVPMLSAEFARGDVRGLQRTVLLGLSLNCVAAICGALFVLTAYSVFAVEPHRSDVDVWHSLMLLVAANGLAGVLGSVGQAAVAAGFMWRGFAVNAVWGGCYLLLSFLLGERGLSGIALARLSAYGLHGLGTFWLLQSCLTRVRQGSGPSSPAR